MPTGINSRVKNQLIRVIFHTYLGRMYATGQKQEFQMPNTTKTAVEIEWKLDTPVREDIYQYIIG